MADKYLLIPVNELARLQEASVLSRSGMAKQNREYTQKTPVDIKVSQLRDTVNRYEEFKKSYARPAAFSIQEGVNRGRFQTPAQRAVIWTGYPAQTGQTPPPPSAGTSVSDHPSPAVGPSAPTAQVTHSTPHQQPPQFSIPFPGLEEEEESDITPQQQQQQSSSSSFQTPLQQMSARRVTPLHLTPQQESELREASRIALPEESEDAEVGVGGEKAEVPPLLRLIRNSYNIKLAKDGKISIGRKKIPYNMNEILKIASGSKTIPVDLEPLFFEILKEKPTRTLMDVIPDPIVRSRIFEEYFKSSPKDRSRRRKVVSSPIKTIKKQRQPVRHSPKKEQTYKSVFKR